MLSKSCLVLSAVVKQQQEEISRNHVPSLFAVSVNLSVSFVARLHSASPTVSDSSCVSGSRWPLSLAGSHPVSRCLPHDPLVHAVFVARPVHGQHGASQDDADDELVYENGRSL